MATMKIKKDDMVRVIAGKDREKEGKVIAVDPKKNTVVVEGVNIAKKHEKPNNVNPDGGIVSKEVPIDASNVMLYDKDAKAATRIGHKVVDGKKVRVSKKSGKVID